MNHLEQLAEWAAALDISSVPERVRHQARRFLLDFMGAAVAGSSAEVGVHGRAAIEPTSKGLGRVIGSRATVGLIDAAFLNGLSGHCLEIDDYHVVRFPLGHVGTVVAPACLALMNADTDPDALLVALVVGAECMIRVSRALGPGHYRMGWHATGTLGGFGAAAGAAHMLGCDGGQTANALAIAGTQSAGFIASFYAHGKPVHAGRAAANGLTAALLANQGMVGTTSIVEGNLGLGRLMTDTFAPEPLVDGLGREFAIEEISFKKYTCCPFDTVDAALVARERFGLDKADGIKKIVVRTTFDFARNQRGTKPKTITGAKVSTEYCVASALVDGSFGLESFEGLPEIRPEVARIMDRVESVQDSDIEKYFEDGNYAVGFDVDYGGEQHSLVLENTIGHYKNPLSDDDLEKKFRTVTRGSGVDADAVIDAVWSLGEQRGGCTELIKALWQ